MTQPLVLDQIKKLVELQKVDGEAYALRRDLAEKPAMLESLTREFEAGKSNLRALEQNAKAVLVDRKQKELELKEKEDAIAKANIHLSQLKTNKEYTAKLAEIENIKADKSIVEEKILLSYDAYETMIKDIEAEKRRVGDLERVFLAGKGKIEDEERGLRERLSGLDDRRAGLLSGIDRNSLNRYEKILRHNDGLAIVPVLRNTCGGCYMNITHQMINQLKMHESLVECEMCARILYLEEDL